MNIRYYPSEASTRSAMAIDDPLLLVISFDRENAIISPVDESVEHHILLSKCGLSSLDIDKYFRVVVDKEGADWTFVCPPDYKNISDRRRRIERFYNDGFTVISSTLAALGYLVGINIPTRYRRHLDELKDGV